MTASGDTTTISEKLWLEGWCQQFPSHSVGDLAFGADGALYASVGDGASFSFADYSQEGRPLNPCEDPPGDAGTVLSPPRPKGALRPQDLRTREDPVGLNGSTLRLEPSTGTPFPGDPLIDDPHPNVCRILAYGLRNPFRFTTRPGTNEIWAGDVGWNRTEEIDRVSVAGRQTTGTRAPCTRTVIEGSSHSLRAPSRFVSEGKDYRFHNWSDGGARIHNIFAPATDTAHRATYRATRR